jgi:hypothetical protein
MTSRVRATETRGAGLQPCRSTTLMPAGRRRGPCSPMPDDAASGMPRDHYSVHGWLRDCSWRGGPGRRAWVPAALRPTDARAASLQWAARPRRTPARATAIGHSGVTCDRRARPCRSRRPGADTVVTSRGRAPVASAAQSAGRTKTPPGCLAIITASTACSAIAPGAEDPGAERGSLRRFVRLTHVRPASNGQRTRRAPARGSGWQAASGTVCRSKSTPNGTHLAKCDCITAAAARGQPSTPA